jgi:hypothetical protein
MLIKGKALLQLYLVSLFTVSGICLAVDSRTLNTARIEQLTGFKGTLNEKGDVFKVSLPRKDLQVTTSGVRMTPPMGLTAWAAFTRTGDSVMVMGDIVLLEEQVNPAMSVALDNGLEVTALHNHFFWDKPKIMFMHIGGMGDEAKLASAVGQVFKALQQKGTSPNPANIDPASTSLDPAKIEAIIGAKGELKDGVYKVVIPKTTQMHGYDMGSAMGVNTWAAFAGSDQEAVVDGDFAMYEDELQGVLKALRKANIGVVAIHNHMTMESPRVMFLHYWGIGTTRALSEGLKAALQTQATSKAHK